MKITGPCARREAFRRLLKPAAGVPARHCDGRRSGMAKEARRGHPPLTKGRMRAVMRSTSSGAT